MTGNTPRPRFVRRQMCNLDAPDDLAAWLVIDTRTGVPLCDAQGIRHFTREDASRELARRNGETGKG